MIHDNKVYTNEGEKFVKTLLVHANEDKYLFYDETLKKPVLTADLKDLFLKGITVVSGEKFLAPVYFDGAAVKCHDGAATLTFTVFDNEIL